MSGGLKYDGGKARMDLLDPYAIEKLAEVLTFGAQKYAAHNWRKGIPISRLLAAAFRHMYALARGEKVDTESGLPHAAHAMCCMMFILWTQKFKPEMDDQWQPEPVGLVVDTRDDELKNE